jgi:hypothetical protein
MSTNIHIRVDREEALAFKKSSLIFQESLLRIVSKIREYKELRKKELILKAKIKRDIANVEKLITHIEIILPKEEPSYLKNIPKEEELKGPSPKIIKFPRTKNEDLEEQLREIREKLARLDIS